MKQGRTFTVYFNQVTETSYTFTARNPDEAMVKAIRAWVREHGLPTGGWVYEDKEEFYDIETGRGK